MLSMLRHFIGPIIVSLIVFVLILIYTDVRTLTLAVILSILEITLSFDNAVVNAKVLERMPPVWQRRFLTWGILIAVFVTRFALPILIVSVAVLASPWFITTLALTNPTAYGTLLMSVKGSITAFGAVFLLMVSLKYFFDNTKELHWIATIERHLARWGHIEAIEIALTLTLLTTISFFSHYDQATVLVAGIIGLMLFIVMEAVTSSLAVTSETTALGGGALFLYLNVLDSAFSLDGVVGAFALTTDLFIIVIGLGIGAYFVRALTVYFVRQKTLTKLIYLEHGAHWAIFGLASAMLVSLIIHVPEIISGLIGLCFVSLAYISSRRVRAR